MHGVLRRWVRLDRKPCIVPSDGRPINVPRHLLVPGDETLQGASPDADQIRATNIGD